MARKKRVIGIPMTNGYDERRHPGGPLGPKKDEIPPNKRPRREKRVTAVLLEGFVNIGKEKIR